MPLYFNNTETSGNQVTEAGANADYASPGDTGTAHPTAKERFDLAIAATLLKGPMLACLDAFQIAIDDTSMKRTQLRVLAGIIFRINGDHGDAYPGYDSLYRYVNRGRKPEEDDYVPRRTIERAVSELLEKGYLVQTKRARRDVGGRAISHYAIATPLERAINKYVTNMRTFAREESERARQRGEQLSADYAPSVKMPVKADYAPLECVVSCETAKPDYALSGAESEPDYAFPPSPIRIELKKDLTEEGKNPTSPSVVVETKKVSAALSRADTLSGDDDDDGYGYLTPEAIDHLKACDLAALAGNGVVAPHLWRKDTKNGLRRLDEIIRGHHDREAAFEMACASITGAQAKREGAIRTWDFICAKLADHKHKAISHAAGLTDEYDMRGASTFGCNSADIAAPPFAAADFGTTTPDTHPARPASSHTASAESPAGEQAAAAGGLAGTVETPPAADPEPTDLLPEAEWRELAALTTADHAEIIRRHCLEGTPLEEYLRVSNQKFEDYEDPYNDLTWAEQACVNTPNELIDRNSILLSESETPPAWIRLWGVLLGLRHVHNATDLEVYDWAVITTQTEVDAAWAELLRRGLVERRETGYRVIPLGRVPEDKIDEVERLVSSNGHNDGAQNAN